MRAAVRPQGQIPPSGGTPLGFPALLALGGGSTCPALSVSGNTEVTIGGDAVVNGTDSGSCTALQLGGTSTYLITGDNDIVTGGSCGGNNCSGQPIGSLWVLMLFSAPLIDGLTGSASECFAGGMQSIGRARVFGQTSMGQALPALFDRLPNGDVLIHAYGDFVTADGTRLEGRGVIPDQLVPLTRADLLSGRDRTMDAALAWMDAARSRRTPQHP